MALSNSHHTIPYLAGRLCAVVYPDGVGSIPQKVIDTIVKHPVAGIGLLTPNIPDNNHVDEIMASMPADASDPRGGLRVEKQGDFWIGYYHQRAAMRRAAALTPEQLSRIGNTLFGKRWQADIAEALGRPDPLDTSRIRQWLSQRRPIPAGVATDLLKMLRDKSAEAAKVADEIEAEVLKA